MADETWKRNPGSRDFNTATNWSQTTVPDGTAFFGVSNVTHLVFSALGPTFGGWTFKKGASHFGFNTSGKFLVFDGAGIVINGGSATIKLDVDGVLNFHQSSTAGKAEIISNGLIQFYDSSHAGTAKIMNNAGVVFYDHSSAEKAVITTANGAGTQFWDNADGGHARLITKAGGNVFFGFCSGPLGDNHISAGSIAGAGDYILGGNVLTVGSNNRSTTVSGEISGTDAQLVKVGTGTLKLTHVNNTYSLATILDAGTFDVAALGAAGPGVIVFDSFISGTHATLKIENAALSTHVFGNWIFNFAAGDKIDLHGLKFVGGAKATLTGTTLTVKSGHVTDTLTLQNPDPGTFKALSDHHGGTKVVLVVPHAKPVAQAAVSEKQVSDHQGDGHHGSLFVDNFEFTYLAGFIDLDRAWMHGFHLGSDLEASLDPGRHETSAWSELTQVDHGHQAHVLVGHDLLL